MVERVDRIQKRCVTKMTLIFLLRHAPATFDTTSKSIEGSRACRYPATAVTSSMILEV